METGPQILSGSPTKAKAIPSSSVIAFDARRTQPKLIARKPGHKHLAERISILWFVQVPEIRYRLHGQGARACLFFHVQLCSFSLSALFIFFVSSSSGSGLLGKFKLNNFWK